VETTMGFTPTGGVIMGTRSGDLDPGLVIYLAEKEGLQGVSHLVEQESGLLGLSGESADLKALLESSSEGARLAIASFVRSIAKAVGSLAVDLGGLDLLVFTGGIGAHASAIRDAVTAQLSFLPPFEVRAMETDEDAMIAQHTEEVLHA